MSGDPELIPVDPSVHKLLTQRRKLDVQRAAANTGFTVEQLLDLISGTGEPSWPEDVSEV